MVEEVTDSLGQLLAMKGLVDLPGKYRMGGVGVLVGEKLIHMAPQAARVPKLMANLLKWLRTTDLHPLLASSIFHYEFEFIHPFADGNGRMGRLWQSAVLSQWNPLFADIPVESLVHAKQSEYYQAINESTQNTDAGPFTRYMLNVILEAIRDASPQVSPQVRRLLEVLQGTMGREQLQQALGLSDRKSFRLRYLAPALALGLIEMTIPSKPNSRLQKYHLSKKAKLLSVT